MKPLAFRITNFRSIVDSGWVPFSPDGVTVLVGQNESGKTSVLDALARAMSNVPVTDDDCRINSALPEIFVRIDVQFGTISEKLSEYVPQDVEATRAFLSRTKNLVELSMSWEKIREDGKSRYSADVDIREVDFNIALSQRLLQPEGQTPTPNDNTAPTVAPQGGRLTTKGLAQMIREEIPLAVLFNAASGLLPNQVDVDDMGAPTGEGAKAASNYLQIAEIDLQQLISGDRRARENILNKANAKVSGDFVSFWSQTIGKGSKLTLKCDVEFYSADAAAKVGKPHLVFWICDGNTQLYPRQRSLGVRWFVSFYLQLRASEKSGRRRMFLLDEPGANLHSKAQADVLELINKLSKDISIVYSTHSPHMIEYAKLFRVHAIQRDGDQEDSPTVIIDAHRLGTASTDTLSPVLTAMGVDLSHQEVIRKDNNVILEEMSGYYYFSAFWKLTNCAQEAHFIAATGANKVETLANMFIGWGLNFVVAVDDDNQGRGVYNNLKREMFGDDDNLAKTKIAKLPDCPGIEDAFSIADFKRLVLKDEQAAIEGKITDYLKRAGRSKPVMAFQFLLDVNNGHVRWETLGDETKRRITAIVEAVKSRLANATAT